MFRLKKFVSLSLIAILVLALVVGCTSDEAKFEDGTYTAESQPDERGWKGVIEIVVEGGEIVSVDYDELDEEGNRKSEDDEYAEAMKGASGVSPAEAYEQLETALVNRQDPDEIDLVTGATSSSEQFKSLAKEALNK